MMIALEIEMIGMIRKIILLVEFLIRKIILLAESLLVQWPSPLDVFNNFGIFIVDKGSNLIIAHPVLFHNLFVSFQWMGIITIVLIIIVIAIVFIACLFYSYDSPGAMS
jgi:hypothetical protein